MKNVYLRYSIIVVGIVCGTNVTSFALQRARVRTKFNPVGYSATPIRRSGRLGNLRSERFQSTQQCPSSRRYATAASSKTSNGNYDDYGISWFFKPRSGKIQILLADFEKKLLDSPTSLSSLQRIVKALAESGSMNATNSEGKTPLIIAIESTAHNTSLSEQRDIVAMLQEHGANLHDPKALQAAVEKFNVGALELLQPHYSLIELYPHFENILDQIKGAAQSRNKLRKLPKMYSICESIINDLEQIARILNKENRRPIVVRVPIVKQEKEQDEFIEIRSVAGLYQLAKEYYINPYDL